MTARTAIAAALAFALSGLALASTATAQVSVLHAPTMLTPDTPTTVTLTLQDESGAGLEIVAIILEFVEPAGVTLADFTWLSGFDDPGLWAFTTDFPAVQTASIATGIAVPAGGTLDFGRFTITAGASTASMSISVLALPENTNATIVDADGLQDLQIISGRSLDFTVGDLPGGSGGGSNGGGTDPGTGNDNANGNDNGAAVDPGNGNGNANGNGNDNGATGGTPDGQMNDNTNGDGETGGGGGSPDDGNLNANDNGSGGGSGEQDPGSNPPSGGGNGPVVMPAPCGMAVIPFSLFTLTLLCGMKIIGVRRVR